MTNNALFRSISITIIISLIQLPVPIYGDDNSLSGAMERLNRDQVLQYGPSYVIDSSLNPKFTAKAENDVMLKNDIDKNSY